MMKLQREYMLDIDKVRELAKKAGLPTLGALCTKAKIHHNSITPYIKKERSPFTQVVIDVAGALNVPVAELVCESEDREIAEVKRGIESLLDSEQAVFLFGSRARRTGKKFSDVDLAITGGKEKIDFAKFSSIKFRVEETFDNFPLSINLVNLDIAPLDFLFEIEPDLVFLCGNEKSANFFLGYLDGRKKN